MYFFCLPFNTGLNAFLPSPIPCRGESSGQEASSHLYFSLPSRRVPRPSSRREASSRMNFSLAFQVSPSGIVRAESKFNNAFLSSVQAIPSGIVQAGSKFYSAFFSSVQIRCCCTCTLQSPVTRTEKRTDNAIKFRPCIDIHKGKVKQIVGSTLRDLSEEEEEAADLSPTAFPLVTNFESEISAAEYARMYKDDGLLGGHVIMLGADAASQAAALSALAAYPGGLQVGGGINPDNARAYLDAGASHVIVTSYMFSRGKLDAERLRHLVHTVGKERLVLDLSCRRMDGQFFVVTERWQCFSELVVNQETLLNLAASADEFLVHGVDVEGKRLGIDDELVSLLGKWSPIPVTYAGGARSLDDLERIKDAGCGAVDVTVGSALDIFGGDLSYQEVVAWHKHQYNARAT